MFKDMFGNNHSQITPSYTDPPPHKPLNVDGPIPTTWVLLLFLNQLSVTGDRLVRNSPNRAEEVLLSHHSFVTANPNSYFQ